MNVNVMAGTAAPARRRLLESLGDDGLKAMAQKLRVAAEGTREELIDRLKDRHGETILRLMLARGRKLELARQAVPEEIPSVWQGPSWHRKSPEQKQKAFEQRVLQNRLRTFGETVASIVSNPSPEGLQQVADIMVRLESMAERRGLDTMDLIQKEFADFYETIGTDDIKGLISTSKEMCDALTSARTEAQRVSFSQTSLRRCLAERLRVAFENAKAPDPGKSGVPSEKTGAREPIEIKPKLTPQEQLAQARAAKPVSLLSIIKKFGGLSRESAKAHGFDVKAMEANLPSIFKDTKGRAGKLEFTQVARQLINQGHMSEAPPGTHLHDWLADKIVARSFSTRSLRPTTRSSAA